MHLYNSLSKPAAIFHILIAAEDDFSPQSTLTITFPPGSSVGITLCAEYKIIGDDLKEEKEEFRVSVTAVNSLDDITGGSEVTLSIVDDGDGENECPTFHASRVVCTIWEVGILYAWNVDCGVASFNIFH